MLTTLRIKNLALVADLTLELRPGFNVISGETGAGKSILIGALSLVLGERADRTLIRSGADSCSVEAVFDVSDLHTPLSAFLDEHGLERGDDHQLLLKRAFTAAGANRQFVNGSPTTLPILSALGEWLVDIHGPHDHQSLLSSARQLAILDAYGNLQPVRTQLSALVRHRKTLEAEKSALIVDERTYAQQLDLLRHQATEIQSAGLRPDEDAQVQREYQRASNASRLMELVHSGMALLGQDDPSISQQMGALGRVLTELKRIDPGAELFLAHHGQISNSLQELQAELSRYADGVEIDPARMQELEDRLNLIQSLKRKYGSTLTDVIAFGEEAARKLRQLEERDAELARLNCALQNAQSELAKIGQDLSTRRRKIIPKLSQAVARNLTDLGFKQSRFEIQLITLPPGASATIALSGFDTVEFQFAPNVGEPPRPLRAIASSGEMARVMLALKTVLAAEDEVPVLVFDEVEANVAGETARTVGEKMRELARRRQVLCITHLAPVAACASAHCVVTKEIKGGRTLTDIRWLESNERVTELARMLGGQSEAARSHAAELLRKTAQT